MTRMTTTRYYILLALAVTAGVLTVIGYPDALAASRHSAATGQPAATNAWMTMALVAGFPAWLWAAVLTFKAKQWSWLAIVTIGSYPGIVVYVVRALRTQRFEGQTTASVQ